MATKRAPAKRSAPRRPATAPEEVLPSTEEVGAAIDAWRATTAVARAARAEEEDARRVLVEVLHRAGLRGIVL